MSIIYVYLAIENPNKTSDTNNITYIHWSEQNILILVFVCYYFYVTVQWSRNGKRWSKLILMLKPPMATCFVYSVLVSRPKTQCLNGRHSTLNTHKFEPFARRCVTSSHEMLQVQTWKKLSTNWCQIPLQRTLRRPVTVSTHCMMFTFAKWVKLVACMLFYVSWRFEYMSFLFIVRCK